MTSHRIFAPRKRRRGLSFFLFAFTFLCVIGAAASVALIGMRSGLVQTALPQVREFLLSAKFLSPANCVVNEAGVIDCHAAAVGTPLPAALAEARQYREQAQHEKTLRLAAEERARVATEALRRLADTAPAQNTLSAMDEQRARGDQPYLMLPGDVVQPFRKRVTLVYRQAVDADTVLIGSDLWDGDREMEFYKVYHATLNRPGLSGDVELTVTPTSAWRDGDRSIRLELKQQAESFTAPE